MSKARNEVFPKVLQQLLHDDEARGVCEWSEDGTYIKIIDTVRFENNLSPRYFSHSKFSSFVRQLHSYGFRKLHGCPSYKHEYQHRFFQRDYPEAVEQMSRKDATRNQAVGAGSDAAVGEGPQLASPRPPIDQEQIPAHFQTVETNDAEVLSHHANAGNGTMTKNQMWLQEATYSANKSEKIRQVISRSMAKIETLHEELRATYEMLRSIAEEDDAELGHVYSMLHSV